MLGNLDSAVKDLLIDPRPSAFIEELLRTPSNHLLVTRQGDLDEGASEACAATTVRSRAFIEVIIKRKLDREQTAVSRPEPEGPSVPIRGSAATRHRAALSALRENNALGPIGEAISTRRHPEGV